MNKLNANQLTVDVANVNKLVWDDVVTVVRGSRGSHGQTVDIEASGHNGEDGDELKEQVVVGN